jgi:hypothetical protein
MMRLAPTCLLAAGATGIPFAAAAEDTMRCRSGRLVNVGMTDVQVVGRCGEPKSRTVEEFPILRRNPWNRTVAPSGDFTRTERWTYERGQGQFDAVLTFDHGKLVRIELLNNR